MSLVGGGGGGGGRGVGVDGILILSYLIYSTPESPGLRERIDGIEVVQKNRGWKDNWR